MGINSAIPAVMAPTNQITMRIIIRTYTLASYVLVKSFEMLEGLTAFATAIKFHKLKVVIFAVCKKIFMIAKYLTQNFQHRHYTNNSAVGYISILLAKSLYMILVLFLFDL